MFADARAAAELQAALAALDVRAARDRAARPRTSSTSRAQEEIAALLRLVGANRGVLELETHRVGRDVQARLNRLLNAEEANLGRHRARGGPPAARPSRGSRRSGALPASPPGLREAAALRRRMPEADLDTLAAALGVSRSAVNHRLRRLVELRQRRRSASRCRPTAPLSSPATGR